MELYPLKFQPIFKERIWGGNRLETLYGKDLAGKTNIGESWELSAVEGDMSVVSNGYLEGNDLHDLIEIYMGELVGDKVFDKFGTEFPLLIKFIDANDDLSIQVHPNDEVAKERHHAFGKTEMWVALDDSESPRLITGFNQDIDKETFLNKLEDNTITSIFHYENAKKDDAFFVPAGRVHAICAGNLVAEIQQTSDITYRIYDYNRTDKDGNQRELHLDLSLEVIDYSKAKDPKVNYTPKRNYPVELVSCPYFTTNILELDHSIEREYYQFDSFAILICTEGEFVIGTPDGGAEMLKKGETILIPASVNRVVIIPKQKPSKLLEVYIK